MNRLDKWDESLSRFLAAKPPQVVEETPIQNEAPSPESPKKSKRPLEEKPYKDIYAEAESNIQQYFYVDDPEKRAALAQTPVAFVEPEHRAYPTDDADKLLTIPGFVSDYVNCLRGMEAPTLMGIWGALWTVSSVLSRDAWIKWYPKPLWPNIYVMIVAPPALCRKSSAMDIGTELLSFFHTMLPKSTEAFLKEQRIVTSKATSEGLLGQLKPLEQVFIAKDGSGMFSVRRSSKITLAISELPTFLDRKNYNMGLISLLLDLYDCKDLDKEITRGRGEEIYEKIYVTFIGAIAPEGLRGSIPAEAFGGGFMSRVVTVYQDVPSKIFSIPREVPGYPNPRALVRPLAWIAHTAKGEYDLTPEAFAFYDKWYNDWKRSLFEKASGMTETYRTDSIVLKTAMLLRVQEYRPGHDIGIEHMKLAIQLVQFTLNRAKAVLRETAVEGNSYGDSMVRVRKVIQRNGEINRRKLLQTLSSSGIRAEEITEILDQLSQEGWLEIVLDGTLQVKASSLGRELYRCQTAEESDAR